MSFQTTVSKATTVASDAAGKVAVPKSVHRVLVVAFAAVVVASQFVSANADLLGIGLNGVAVDLAVASFLATLGRVFVPAD